MATSTPTMPSKPSFMDLPPELRVMVYEKLAELGHHKFMYFTHLRHAGYYATSAKEATKYLAITRVSRQIRQEALPILYRDYRIVLKAKEFKDKEQLSRACKWLSKVDPAIFAALAQVDINLGSSGCWCSVHILLDRLEQPAMLDVCYFHKPSYHLRSVNQHVLKAGEELASTLKIGQDKKLVMTNEAMKSLVSKFSGMDF